MKIQILLNLKFNVKSYFMNILSRISEKLFGNKLTKSIAELKDNQRQQLFVQRKYLLEQRIMSSETKGVTDEKYCDKQIIVSLTTYGNRIYDVHLTIESIMEQTMLPNRIILWLDNSFQNTLLPCALKLLQKRGLEIKYCRDIRSYTKLIPSLRHFPDDVIITVDDDLIYEFDLLERLIQAYQENPSYIYCHRYHRMLKDKHDILLPYNKWSLVYNDMQPSHLNFATGVGGVLYPPHSLDDEVLNEDVFLKLCPYADDVWFKAMALKKGTLVKKVHSHSRYSEDFLLNMDAQSQCLQQMNVGNQFNDKQLHAVFTRYSLYPLLK